MNGRGRYFLYIALFAMAVAIQWPLWFGKGGITRLYSLERELASIREANERLRAENDSVAAEIESLESGSGAVEERARMRLGMIKADEVLFRFVARSGQENPAKSTTEKPETKTKPHMFAPKRSDLYIDGEVAPPAVPQKSLDSATKSGLQ
ncbi:MAG: cell division protein FtsB [Sutterellaceae bacterium]|nr:cell division protein FtsB [Sutterellaceae bacterium]